MHGRMDSQTNGQNKQTAVQTDEQKNGEVDRQTNDQTKKIRQRD